MDHNEILRMIETVDPSDVGGMEKIDDWVWCFLNGYDFTRALQDHTLYKAHIRGAIEKYTRSRDALKAIRPEGWLSWAQNDETYKPGYFGKWYMGCAQSEKTDFYVGDLPTEELAELHAIIQAIAYERSAQKGAEE